MRFKRANIVLGLLIAVGMGFEFSAHADELKETTRVTFSAPVQIPGRVLPAGTYIFEDADKVDFPDRVQVFNADRTVLYATLQTVPVERMQATGDPAITLAETDAGKTSILVKWFYSDSLTGHELVYPKQEEREVHQATRENFVGSRLVQTAEAVGE